MDTKLIEQRLRWIVVGVTCFLVALILLNGGFFLKQVNYWWQQDVTGNGFEINDIAGESDRIAIPRIGVEAPLLYVDTVDEGRLQEALIDGVVHYWGTAMPGEYGNAYFFGHSSNFPTKPGEFKTVFALLTQLREGDEIMITNHFGTKYTYRILDREIIKPNRTDVVSQGDSSKRILTLQTSYPLGLAIWRYIVIAEMI